MANILLHIKLITQLILTSASVLPIEPENLPVHPINVVGTALVSDTVQTTNLGIQFNCIVSDYISKEKPSEISITLFHPINSRLKNQTTTLKRGSSIFFSGTLMSIDNKLYLELHNFSFARTQSNSISKSTKEMPWSTSSTSSSSSSHMPITKSVIHQKIQEQQIAPILGKHGVVTKFQPNKLTRLSDIASNALVLAETSMEVSEDLTEEIQEREEEPVSIITPLSKKRKPRVKKV